MKTLKNISLIFIIIIACLLLCEAGLRIVGMQPAHAIEYEYELIVEPQHFFKPDSLLGWQSGKGTFNFNYNHTIPLFKCTVLPNGNRAIPLAQNAKGKKIHLYGCSYTFGYSVNDTQTMAYYLQQQLPQYYIQNKAVPGYGLAQMYLRLQQSLAQGDTPAIAIVNYGSLHHMRSPLHYGWSSALRFAILQSFSKTLNTYSHYPYIQNKNIVHFPFQNTPQDWPFRDKSALINIANTLYENHHDATIEPQLNQDAYTALNFINAFCKKNNITLLLGLLDNDKTPIIKHTTIPEASLIPYAIDIQDTLYNCAPYDPTHPNARAHRLYAKAMKMKIDSFSSY